MAGLAELAAVMIGAAQRRLEVAAGNIGNLNTPGYRARRAFQHVIDDRLAIPATSVAYARREGPAALKATGNPLDIAIAGPAVLMLRRGDGLVAAASAQLQRDGDGRLLDARGGVLQAAGGGDLVIGEGVPTILKDGTVLIGGQPEARIGIFAGTAGEFADRRLASDAFPDPAEAAVLHQGMVVPSSVDLGAEMVDLTAAGRLAEAGARIFQIGDELLGKAAATLGEMRR